MERIKHPPLKEYMMSIEEYREKKTVLPPEGYDSLVVYELLEDGSMKTHFSVWGGRSDKDTCPNCGQEIEDWMEDVNG